MSVEHGAVGCVVVGQFSFFQARFHPAERVASARIYFRPDGGQHWYFVPLTSNAGWFAGVLPKPRKELKSFSYYIEAIDRDLAPARTPEYSPSVVSESLACKDRVIAATVASAAITVGLPAGSAALPLVPAGFSSAGVVAAGGTAAATGGGIGAKGIVAGAGAAGAATVAAVVLSGSDPLPALPNIAGRWLHMGGAIYDLSIMQNGTALSGFWATSAGSDSSVQPSSAPLVGEVTGPHNVAIDQLGGCQYRYRATLSDDLMTMTGLESPQQASCQNNTIIFQKQ